MKTKCLLASALCVGILAAQTPEGEAAKRPTQRARRAAAVTPAQDTSPDTVPDNAPDEARVVSYAQNDVVRIKAKLRYTTMIVLPKTELILDFTCGDKDLWVINGSQNFAYVKPAKAGAQTNLNLVTAGGNIYSFLLTEVSATPKAAPDLKVFVELKDDEMNAASQAAPKFVPAQEVETYKAQLEVAKDELRQRKAAEPGMMNAAVNRFVANMRFTYRFEGGKKPFYVRAMYHDDRVTHILARPEETPTLYEIKDGMPNMINFDFKDGLYVVDKILDRGYLAIGKQKLPFKREE